METTIITRTVQKTLSQPEKTLTLSVNGSSHQVVAAPDTPLLYVLREQVQVNGPRFGCGLGQCGACTVHLDGKPVRSCITSVSSAAGHKITTLDGLSAEYHGGNGSGQLHPVQQAWIDEQAPQCGSCQNGWIMYSAYLLATTKKPSEDQIRAALTGLKCRCGSQVSILRAVRRAAKQMGEA